MTATKQTTEVERVIEKACSRMNGMIKPEFVLLVKAYFLRAQEQFGWSLEQTRENLRHFRSVVRGIDFEDLFKKYGVKSVRAINEIKGGTTEEGTVEDIEVRIAISHELDSDKFTEESFEFFIDAFFHEMDHVMEFRYADGKVLKSGIRKVVDAEKGIFDYNATDELRTAMRAQLLSSYNHRHWNSSDLGRQVLAWCNANSQVLATMITSSFGITTTGLLKRLDGGVEKFVKQMTTNSQQEVGLRELLEILEDISSSRIDEHVMTDEAREKGHSVAHRVGNANRRREFSESSEIASSIFVNRIGSAKTKYDIIRLMFDSSILAKQMAEASVMDAFNEVHSDEEAEQLVRKHESRIGQIIEVKCAHFEDCIKQRAAELGLDLDKISPTNPQEWGRVYEPKPRDYAEDNKRLKSEYEKLVRIRVGAGR